VKVLAIREASGRGEDFNCEPKAMTGGLSQFSAYGDITLRLLGRQSRAIAIGLEELVWDQVFQLIYRASEHGAGGAGSCHIDGNTCWANGCGLVAGDGVISSKRGLFDDVRGQGPK